jgi:hypothetical protein
MKNYSNNEIKLRTDRLSKAREIRTKTRIKKDEIVCWMIKQVYPNGLVIGDLVHWGILPRTFLKNSLDRLEIEGKIYRKKQYHTKGYNSGKLVSRYFFKIPIGDYGEK